MFMFLCKDDLQLCARYPDELTSTLRHSANGLVECTLALASSGSDPDQRILRHTHPPPRTSQAPSHISPAVQHHPLPTPLLGPKQSLFSVIMADPESSAQALERYIASQLTQLHLVVPSDDVRILYLWLFLYKAADRFSIGRIHGAVHRRARNGVRRQGRGCSWDARGCC